LYEKESQLVPHRNRSFVGRLQVASVRPEGDPGSTYLCADKTANVKLISAFG
jgi:hypothetical protein